MLPFPIPLRHGEPIADQIVFAAMRAMLAGEIREGEAFPSVRSLALALGAHPNTVHKAVQRLIAEGWLESRPGIGAFVVRPPQPREGEGARLLDQEVGRLVVEARRVGVGLESLILAIRTYWKTIEGVSE